MLVLEVFHWHSGIGIAPQRAGGVRGVLEGSQGMDVMHATLLQSAKRAKAFPSSQSAIVIACSSRFLGSGRVRGKAMPHTILNDAMRKSATL